jgi:hypothetical protein
LPKPSTCEVSRVLGAPDSLVTSGIRDEMSQSVYTFKARLLGDLFLYILKLRGHLFCYLPDSRVLKFSVASAL